MIGFWGKISLGLGGLVILIFVNYPYDVTIKKRNKFKFIIITNYLTL